ncbi:GMC oxidoreductase [Colletotrichum graminicola]|uniref:GMC oxidoreductase n=1 Tax=Colletotrichum graminicola (strain M1.001 / M2 / FGSC 10212) TaxID=645133 RepID=E3QZI5_COLGM|nr:GMC oxidoreductase [Colletotrichum graminicola M1.001]EFQ36273.1 GMC oxidoreductase [Colletotrichum graminicola M1.001]WDK23705.1 GMC oxidoreductase [Colletotrichum graminicola]
MFKSLLSAGLLAAAAAAQQTSSYVDAASGITFQRHSETSGFAFGIALPTTVGKDFIGQISAPVSTGWASVSLGGPMTNKILVVAWPNGDSVQTSIRKASGYSNPDVVTDSGITLKPIASGISVNETSFTYTFLCQGCITGDETTFTGTADITTFGWAYSTTALSDTSSASVALNYHGAGFGLFGANLADAKSADYATWAAKASDAATTPGAGNGTAPSVPANVTTTISNTTYDYIVAGGGAAGLIVAERLAESGKSVLLLERGGASIAATGGKATLDWNNTVTQYDVPAMGYYLSTAKETSEYCTDTASQAGCLLGGSTMVNAMMWVKPAAHDFDDKWPAGWKWSDVEESANKLYERTPGTILPSKDGKRYDQGAYDVMSKWLAGNGFTEVNGLAEPNKKEAVFTHPPWLIENGLRGGPIRDYLPRAQAMPNFKLQLNAKVVRAVRNGTTISGIEVETGKNTRQIINLKSGGAAILAAGALSTPRILFNSGIGPKEQIQTVKSGSVPVTLPAEAQWIDLPVGQNLKDHPIFTVNFQTKSTLNSLASTAFTSPSQTDVDEFAQGSGLLAQAGQRLNFWTSVEGSDGQKRYVQGTVNSPKNDTIRVKVYLTHGLTSVGALGISADGSTKLTTEPYLTTKGDKDAITSFMNQLIKYASKSNSTLALAGNATAESLISEYVTGSHFVGSAIMGTKNDGKSVVDTQTKVWGTENLFVVDASIHPDLPTGNTQAIVMVAAEHAAAQILGGAGTGNSTGGSDSCSGKAGYKRATRRAQLLRHSYRASRNF